MSDETQNQTLTAPTVETKETEDPNPTCCTSPPNTDPPPPKG
jgi:hypothetical protein